MIVRRMALRPQELTLVFNKSYPLPFRTNACGLLATVPIGISSLTCNLANARTVFANACTGNSPRHSDALLVTTPTAPSP